MSPLIHRPGIVGPMSQAAIAATAARAASAGTTDIASADTADIASPQEEMHRLPMESTLYVRPCEGTDIPSLARKLVEENRRREPPKARIVINAERWSQPLAIDTQLQGALTALADEHGTSICFKTSLAPYAIECDPPAERARQSSAGALLAMLRPAGVTAGQRRHLERLICAKGGGGADAARHRLDVTSGELSAARWPAQRQYDVLLQLTMLARSADAARVKFEALSKAVAAMQVARWNPIQQSKLLAPLASQEQVLPGLAFPAIASMVDAMRVARWTPFMQQDLLAEATRSPQWLNLHGEQDGAKAWCEALAALRQRRWKPQRQHQYLKEAAARAEQQGEPHRAFFLYSELASNVRDFDRWTANQQYEHRDFLLECAFREALGPWASPPASIPTRTILELAFGPELPPELAVPNPAPPHATAVAFLRALFVASPASLRDVVGVLAFAQKAGIRLHVQMSILRRIAFFGFGGLTEGPVARSDEKRLQERIRFKHAEIRASCMMVVLALREMVEGGADPSKLEAPSEGERARATRRRR